VTCRCVPHGLASSALAPANEFLVSQDPAYGVVTILITRAQIALAAWG
jgi:hypothetical protein